MDRRPAGVGGLLVVTAGLIASGKSTVGERIARELAAPRVVADAVRQELQEADEREPHAVHEAAWQKGFSHQFADAIYDELFRRAEAHLERAGAVVMDGCFASRAMRERARELATEHQAHFLLVECRVDPVTLERRLRERARRAGIAPDAWLQLLAAFSGRWEPVVELPGQEHLVLDTSHPLDEGWLRVERRLAELAASGTA